MKRTLDLLERQSPLGPASWLTELPCDLLVHIARFLPLVDLQTYARVLFSAHGIFRGRFVFHDLKYNETQHILLDGLAPLLREKNTTQWPGWAQDKAAQMRLQLSYVASNATLTEVEAQIARVVKIAQCRHYELFQFVVDPLCERCEARQSSHAAPRLCQPCWDEASQRVYRKQLPPQTDPYSWIGPALVRRQLQLGCITNVYHYAREKGVRIRDEAKPRLRLYLLKDL